MICPKCQHDNPPKTLLCACGWNLRSGGQGVQLKDAARLLPADTITKLGVHDMRVGAIWLAGGVVVSLVLYFVLREERRTLIATGAIFWGLMQFLRGVDRYRTGRIRPFWNFKA